MTQFNYTKNIPEQTHNPSVDAPDMKINTNSTNDLIAVDHIGFNTPDGGTHKQVQLKNITVPIPVGLQNGFETLYSKAVAGNGEILFTRGNSGVGIQLTGPGTPTASASGSTFLPGGIVMKWGSVTIAPNNTGTVNFSPVFPNNCFVIMGNPVASNMNPSSGASVGVNTFSNTQFTFKFVSGSNSYTGFQWVAIGN